MDRHELSPAMVHGPGTIMVVCSAGDAWATGEPDQVHQDMARHLEIVGDGQPVVYRPEPVTHEATDPEWDEEAQEFVLACSCGTWETRGDVGGLEAAWEAHLDAEGVPANALAQLEADQREARRDTLAAVRALGGGRTWPRVSWLMEAAERLALTIPANSPEAGAQTELERQERIAEQIGTPELERVEVPRVFSRTARGPEDVDDTGLMAAVQRMSPGYRGIVLKALEEGHVVQLPSVVAESVEGLASVAKALGVDTSRGTPSQWATAAVAVVQHRERVKAATELSRAVGQFPEILATAAPELRSALRTMLADAADALAEPDPTELERPAASGVYGSGVLGVFLDTTRRAHRAGGRCWCRVAHGHAEALELNRRAGF